MSLKKVRTGVIDNNSVDFLNDNTINGNDIVNLSYEEWREEYPDADEDDYEPDGEVLLIGWKKEIDGNYEPDNSKNLVAIIDHRSHYTSQIIKSDYLMKGAMCSPCYPNQIDLDSEGDEIGYCFPPDWFEDDNPIVKSIFKPEPVKFSKP